MTAAAWWQRVRRVLGRRELRSASFGSAQQTVSLVASAVVGVVVARALTTSDFGLYSAVVSLVAIGTAVANGGIGTLGIKILLDDPDAQNRSVSAFLLLRELLAVVAFLALVGVAQLTDPATTVPAAVAGLALFAKGLDCTDAWFQSRVRTGAVSLVRIGVVLVLLAARVVAALVSPTITTFLLLYVAEAVLSAGAVALTYLRSAGSPGFGRPQPRRAWGVVVRSWPLLLANLARQINLRADVVLLVGLAGTGAAGIYTVAARLSEIAYFLPIVFTTATFPALLAARREWGAGSARYRATVQRSYDRACWAGVAIAAVTFVLGPPVIDLLYGSRYGEAAGVLRIHVLALPFVFMSAVLGKWVVAEGHLLQTLSRQAAGALVNVGLNLVLIPAAGIRGAAVATVASYVVSSYLFTFVGGRRGVGGGALLPAGVQMTKALVWPLRLLRDRSRRGPSTDGTDGATDDGTTGAAGP
ncbi:flippase [Pseudokineococcus basanitobsidens]|uniref:Flippase n=1 Tax=Pseudokineococcus basanitobsidens TaxID=1926649 RepID=A0ABU8RK25_9ACTN